MTASNLARTRNIVPMSMVAKWPDGQKTFSAGHWTDAWPVAWMRHIRLAKALSLIYVFMLEKSCRLSIIIYRFFILGSLRALYRANLAFQPSRLGALVFFTKKRSGYMIGKTARNSHAAETRAVLRDDKRGMRIRESRRSLERRWTPTIDEFTSILLLSSHDRE